MRQRGAKPDFLRVVKLNSTTRGWPLRALLCSLGFFMASPGNGALHTPGECGQQEGKSCLDKQQLALTRASNTFAAQISSLDRRTAKEAGGSGLDIQDLRQIERMAMERSLASFSAADTVIAFSALLLTVVGLLLTAVGILGFGGVRQLKRARETLESITHEARSQSEGVKEVVDSLKIRADDASTRIDELRSYIERESRAAVLASFEMSLGRLSFEHGDCNRAIQHYSKALDYRPDETTLLVDIGRCFVHLKDNEQATAFFNRALGKDKDLAEAHFGIATACRLTDLRRSRTSIETAVRLNPDNYNYYDFLAAIQRAEDKYLEAEESCKKSFQLKPMHDSAMWMACLAKLRGDLSQYECYLEEAFQLAIEDVKVGFRVARAEFTLWFVYLARENIKEADQAISSIGSHGVSKHLADLLVVNISTISKALSLTPEQVDKYVHILRQSACVQSIGDKYA